MSTKYLFAAIQAKTDDPIAKVILIFLADSANQDGQCFPSHSTIAEVCETSVRTVKRKLDELCAMGFIEWENRGHKGYKTSNLYQLCEPSMLLTNGRVEGDKRREKGEAMIGQPDTTIGQPDITDRSQWPIEPISNLSTTTTTRRPSVEEVEDYVKTRDVKISAQQFIDYYTANGWKVGRNSMKDWKAAVRTWERREKPKPSGRPVVESSTRSRSIHDDLTDKSWAS